MVTCPTKVKNPTGDVPHAEATFASLTNGDFSHLEARRAYLELRFLSLNACIARMGATQVLDLATGVAPRGLILSEDPSVLVIETDLPEMIAEKQAIVASLLPFAARPDYRLCAANALHNTSSGTPPAGSAGSP